MRKTKDWPFTMATAIAEQLPTLSRLNLSPKPKSCPATAVSALGSVSPHSPLQPTLHHLLTPHQNGDLFIYPPKSAVKVSGGENLTGYGFLSEKCLHSFCRKCGVSVLVKNIAEEDEDMPINVRTIQGVDLGGLVYQEYDGAANDPQYAL